MRRFDYDLYTSEFVISAAATGDPHVARLCLNALSDIPAIELNEPAVEFADLLVTVGPLPPNTALEFSPYCGGSNRGTRISF